MNDILKYMKQSDYWICKDMLIMKPFFNKSIDTIDYDNVETITTIIFSNYANIVHSLIDDHIKSLDILSHGELIHQDVLTDSNNDKDYMEYLSGRTLVYGNFNKSIDKVGTLFPQLTRLVLSNNFNQLIDNLPPELIFLSLDYNFNHPIDNLPLKLTYLTLNTHFNQIVDNLPNNLTHLILGTYFNHPIDNLPHSLTHLTLCHYFNQTVDNLPSSLIYLRFIGIFDKPLNNLPFGIETLILPVKYNCQITNIPSTLKTVKCAKSYLYINKLDSNVDIYHL
jgi:hypothetical protein